MSCAPLVQGGCCVQRSVRCRRRRCEPPSATSAAHPEPSKTLLEPVVLTAHTQSRALVADAGGAGALQRYMTLPVEQYFVLDPSRVERLEGSCFRCRVPRLAFLSVWLEPEVDVEVSIGAAEVRMRSTGTRLRGSDFVASSGINERFDMAWSTVLTWGHSDVDVASGAKTRLDDDGPEDIAWGGGTFTPDGGAIWTTTDKDSEFARLVTWTPATGGIEVMAADIPWEVEEFDVSEDGKSVCFITNEAGVSRARVLDTATGRHRLVAGLPEGVIAGGEWHADGRHLAFSVGSARSTSDVYVWDAVEGGPAIRWTESELGGLVAETLVEPRAIDWQSFDGLKIRGFLYPAAPRFTGRRPVIINIHGGPEGQSRPIFQGRNNFFMSELGVALVFPNVRGSTGYGKTFVKLDNALKREDSVRDIGALLDWIATRPDLDPDRVMITGGSYGGFMTLACATTYDERIRCALDVVGISHFTTFLKNTESYRRDLRRVEYGDERVPEVAEFFERIAPLNNAGRITKPLFVVQGANDPRVPASEAEQMVAKVRENGGPVWFLNAKDEGHGFRKKPNMDFQFYATVMFVRQHLLGGESAADAAR